MLVVINQTQVSIWMKENMHFFHFILQDQRLWETGLGFDVNLTIWFSKLTHPNITQLNNLNGHMYIMFHSRLFCKRVQNRVSSVV